MCGDVGMLQMAHLRRSAAEPWNAICGLATKDSRLQHLPILQQPTKSLSIVRSQKDNVADCRRKMLKVLLSCLDFHNILPNVIVSCVELRAFTGFLRAIAEIGFTGICGNRRRLFQLSVLTKDEVGDCRRKCLRFCLLVSNP